ncbi:MAG: HAMP domain-containing protein, partial [Beijerinckiaceae bacterium]|nr:HAMP domain-containing protein [Beijerinckiaceae bacterium]
MRPLLPDSLGARTIAVMVVGLSLSHLASMGAYRIDLLAQTDSAMEQEAVERIVSARASVLKAPMAERERTAALVSGRMLDAHWSRTPVVGASDPADARFDGLRDRLLRAAPELHDPSPRLAFADAHGGLEDGGRSLLVSAPLPDGDWLNLRAELVEPLVHTPRGLLLSTGLMALAVVALSILLVRSATGPLRAMARAAERLGVDVTAPPLPETGPSEVRQAARAFNEMQGRIRRLLTDRTQMFAALSHDLRTPLTILRLRAEFVEDEEQHAKMLADIAEMESMIDATLAFLRDDGAQEATEAMDLAATLATMCDTLTDAGRQAHYSGEAHATLCCRPMELRRAFRNLIDNAVKYGDRAQVELSVTTERIVVDILDDGPGIPASEREKVFQPFYRMERSRNRETGGFGLGLTVARAAIHAHGGDIVLADRPEGG